MEISGVRVSLYASAKGAAATSSNTKDVSATSSAYDDSVALWLQRLQADVEKDRANYLARDYFGTIFSDYEGRLAIGQNAKIDATHIDSIVQTYQDTRSSILKNHGGFYSDEEIEFKLRDLSTQYDKAMGRAAKLIVDGFNLDGKVGDIIDDDIKAHGVAMKMYMDSGNRFELVERSPFFYETARVDYSGYKSAWESRTNANLSMDELFAFMTVRDAQRNFDEYGFAPQDMIERSRAQYGYAINLNEKYDALKQAHSFLNNHESDMGKSDVFQMLLNALYKGKLPKVFSTL